MKRLALSLFILSMLSLSAFSQEKSDSAELKTVEFISPIKADGKFDRNPVRKNCFSFITETAACGKVSDIYYGNLRAGNDWDWLQVMGEGSRNKIKRLGRKNWTDELKIPVVEPYAKLREGEQRLVVLDASGKDGEDGKPGINGDGTINSVSNVFVKELRQTNPDVRKAESDYQPFEKAVLGNMYVMRVVDEKNDLYVLFRIDELEKGTRCRISWKIIPAPQKD